MYFLDETKSIDLENKYYESQICVGLIMIDNFEEVNQRISDEEKPLLMAQIEKKIYDWATEFEGLIVKSERDTFVYIFERKHLEKLEENKFNILDTIKELEVSNKIQITLSISISTEGESNYEKYKFAQAGLDIALGRGGDQAVIRQNGKYLFFGGKVEEVEKRTKVKARIVAHALEELIKDQNIAIDELRQKQDISTETVADRIKNLKKNVLDNIRFDNENTISELVDSYIEKITIYNDRSEWILNYIDGIINLDIKGQERSSKKELYMTPLRKAFRSA